MSTTEPSPIKPSGRRTRLSAEQRRELIERAAAETFAESGYRGASMDEIARRAGVSVPVLYDHFGSKQELHRRLLERHFAELRELWRERMAGEEPAGKRVERAFDAWFEYVQTHPYAGRMLFADTSGDPDVQAIHREVAARSREAVLPVLVSELEGVEITGGLDADMVDMLWETIRGVLQSLACWWYDHRHVPREKVLAVAMNTLWVGLEHCLKGEAWDPTIGHGSVPPELGA